MGEFVLSAFADEYSEHFSEQLSGLQSFGIDHIEVRHIDGKNISVLKEGEVKEAKKMLDGYGIRVSAIGSPLGKIKLDADINGHLEVARSVFEYANILGTPYIRMFSFYAPDGKDIYDMRDEAFEALNKMLTLADTCGVTLCHENEAKIYGDTPERCREIIDTFSGKIKCVFDMGNFLLEGVDPYPTAYELLQDSIAYFHIKDALREGAIVPPGCGEAKIKEILTAHKQYVKGSFFVSLEPHLETFAGLNALVGRGFTNPYKYDDTKAAFTDAVKKFREYVK